MRFKSRMAVPDRAGEVPPYARFLPVETGHSGNFVLVGDLHDRLHFFHVCGRHGRGGDFFLLFVPGGRIRVTIEVYVVVAGENPILADNLFEMLHRSGEVFAAYTGWKPHDVVLECESAKRVLYYHGPRHTTTGELFVRPCDYEWVEGEREFKRERFRRFADGVAALLVTNVTR